jgi:hypothetical protein
MSELSEYEKNLIDYLRKEAGEVKNCFTQFSFQVIAISAVALGLIARFQPTFPLLGLASISVVLMALAVGRIGTYKYATANRIHGYELYLDRVRRLRDTEGWNATYRFVGWEEGVRAWRTVQPTVFRLYYKWGDHTRNTLKKKYRDLSYPWFEPKRLHREEAVYYAGSYLRTMLSILFMIVYLGIASMIMMTVQFLLVRNFIGSAAAGIITLGILLFAVMKTRQLSQRRRLLEEGILCIHSCAIIWQLVVVAHNRAVEQLPGFENAQVNTFEGYTAFLSLEAADLREHLKNGGSPHTWIHRREIHPPGNGA